MAVFTMMFPLSVDGFPKGLAPRAGTDQGQFPTSNVSSNIYEPYRIAQTRGLPRPHRTRGREIGRHRAPRACRKEVTVGAGDDRASPPTGASPQTSCAPSNRC